MAPVILRHTLGVYMQPYQQASQEIQRQGEMPIRAAKAGAGLALGAASSFAGSQIFQRIAPFLSQYIPQNIARKGFEKIDPRFGEFFDLAEKHGQTFESAKQFIADKASEAMGEQETKDDRNIIQKYSPELFQTLEWFIKQGFSPAQAAIDMRLTEDSKVLNLISQMEKDYKQDWPSIVESVFGQAGVQKKPSMDIAEAGNAQMMSGQRSGNMFNQALVNKVQKALSS